MQRGAMCGDSCDEVRHLVAESLNRIGLGIAILTPAGEILEMNRCARDIVARGDVLTADGSHLIATSPANAALLQETLQKVTATTARHGSFLTLTRNGRGRRLHVYVAPVRLDGERKPRAASLYLSEPDRVTHANEELLTTLFGLSPAESRVAAGIAEGLAVPALADRLHVSVHTVRTQLKSVFAKTGAQRQSDLVRLLTSGLALVTGER